MHTTQENFFFKFQKKLRKKKKNHKIPSVFTSENPMELLAKDISPFLGWKPAICFPALTKHADELIVFFS